jgi:hypothetical protein
MFNHNSTQKSLTILLNSLQKNVENGSEKEEDAEDAFFMFILKKVS